MKCKKGEKMSSQAYTPGLKRKENYVVEKTRRLPIQGEVLVKEGDVVTDDTIVARTEIPGDPEVVNVATTLAVEPDEAKGYMLKKVGDSIEKGEPIALMKGFFGLFKTTCNSPVSGKLEHFSEETGQAIVRTKPISVQIKAYIPGKVVKELPKEGVIIQTTAAFIQGIFGIGGETRGEIMMLSKKPEDVLESSQITQECKGKIIIGGALVTSDGLRKAVEVGARGIIVGGINDRDITSFLGYDIGVAITGQEEAGLTLIITEGFGKMAMQEKTFRMFEKFEGKLACINGATQIRAGVMRPEIVIPSKDTSTSKASMEEEEDNVSEGLRPKTLIRLIRDPYFGELGRVTRLPVELQKLETESTARVVEVQLEDGRKVLVPRANVEIIEE